MDLDVVALAVALGVEVELPRKVVVVEIPALAD